jgi:GNAT superfamily N-acetyltransferase
VTEATPTLAARRPNAALTAAVSFRAATLDDVTALVPMINEAYLREAHVIPGPRITVDELRGQLPDASSQLRVAMLSGEPAGCVRVRLRADGAWFGLLATRVAVQGRGLASLLIGEAERFARSEGCAIMRLECARELGMAPYYASLGYEIETVEPDHLLTGSTPPYRQKGRITRVVMRKVLA